MNFTSAVILHKNGGVTKTNTGTKLWTVTSSYGWYIDYENKLGYIEVPVGFEHDFGSIPRFLWWLINPTGYLAFILHDYMYHELINYNVDGETFKSQRLLADRVMYEALIVEGMNKYFAKLCFWGVKLFGRKYHINERIKKGISLYYK